MQEIVNAMRARAAQIGCDAIVITGSDKVVVGSSSSVNGSGSGSVQTLDGIKGVCIVYNSPETATASAAPQAGDVKPTQAEPSDAQASTKPNGAAGFTFGQSLDAVQAACVGAQHQWAQVKGARYSCSGTPKSVGMPATLVLRFCQNRLCEVNVDPRPSDLRENFRSIQTALARKYGDAKKTTEDVPDDCAADQLAKCVADARATLLSEWWWETGERITAKVMASDADGTGALRITYSKWPLDPPDPPKGEGL